MSAIEQAVWEQWREHAATKLIQEAEELEAGGGPGVFNEDQRSIAAQTYRNAASKIRNMRMPSPRKDQTWPRPSL